MNVYYEEAEVQQLLNAYQKLLGIRISVLNSDFVGLYRSSSRISTFCKKVRQNSDINRACKHCDQVAYQKAKELGDTYIYKCHLGLYEAITPIIDNERTIGYLMIGQVLGTEEIDHQWENLLLKHSKFSLDLSACEKEFLELKQTTLDHFKAMSQIMKACAHSILLSHIVHIETSPITDLISGYIERYYNEPISVEQISKALNMSRTTIYNYMKNEYNMSLTKYVNNFRLEKAKILLESTTDSIAVIASHVGYDNYGYFTRQFKVKYGLTPSQYRKIKTSGLQ